MKMHEAKSLKVGDHVEFADPAFEHCFFAPTRGIVVWIMQGEDGIPEEYEIGISWEGKPAVSQDPTTDFEHVRRITNPEKSETIQDYTVDSVNRESMM